MELTKTEYIDIFFFCREQKVYMKMMSKFVTFFMGGVYFTLSLTLA